MRRALIIMAVIAFALAGWAKYDWDQRAAKRKAEAAFIEAQNQFGQGNLDQYYMLLQRAVELDSTDLDIAGEWARLSLLMEKADSATAEKAFRAMFRLFDANRDNYLTGMQLANMARNYNRFADEARVWAMLDSAFPNYAQPLQELGQAYLLSYAQGDTTAYAKALSTFDRLEKAYGKSVNLTSQRIRAYMFVGDTVSTLSEIEVLAKDAPNDCYTAFYVGSIYGYLGDNDKALAYYDRAAELDSTIGAVYIARAELFKNQGDTAAYDREMRMAVRSPNLEVEQKTDIMRQYVSSLIDDSTQYSNLRALFNELELMHPGEAPLHSLYASYLYTIRDYHNAAEQASYSVALDSADEDSWTLMVQCCLLDEDKDNVVKYGKEAMEMFPHNFYYPIAIAQAYHTADQTKEAIDVLNSVDISDVQNPKAVANLISFKADLYTTQGDTATALTLYDQAIDYDPENALAMNNAAYFMSLQGQDLDKAERYAAKAVGAEPENPTYMDTYAWVFFKKKDYNMARNYIDITLNLFGLSDKDKEAVDQPEDDSVQEEAVDEVVEMVEEDDKTPSADIYEHAGDIYFMCGEPAKALEFWKKAYELDPDSDILKRKVKHKTYFYE